MRCFYHFHFEMCFAPQRRAVFEHLNFQKCSAVFWAFWLQNVPSATTACTSWTSQHTKVVPTWRFIVLTATCALRHNGMHFSNISRAKSAPNLVSFVRFDLDMCFARVLFDISTSKSAPKFLSTLTSKCASRHSDVQLFISHLPRWLRTCRFSKPTFRPLRSHKTLDKHSVSRLFYLFAHLDLLFTDSFSSLIFFLLSLLWLFPPLGLHLSILSEVWLLNFLRSARSLALLVVSAARSVPCPTKGSVALAAWIHDAIRMWKRCLKKNQIGNPSKLKMGWSQKHQISRDGDGWRWCDVCYVSTFSSSTAWCVTTKVRPSTP